MMDLHKDRMYWTKDGGPFTFDEYVAQMRERPGETRQDAWDRVHRVALDQVGKYEVSTVCLMVDVGFNRVERFETMVFADGHCVDEAVQRYATVEQAIAGHDQMVARFRDRAS